MSKVVRLFSLLDAAGYDLAVAESCSGGLLAGEITSVPGSSRVFAGAVVAYSNKVKTDQLNVDNQLIKEHGAVSQEVARAMSEGICSRFDVSFSISTTGIAGPGGGSKDKPVGLVYISTCSPQKTEVSKNIFTGNRRLIREKTVSKALDLAIEHLS